MRTKTLIYGFKNSQKIRVIIDGLGIYMTVGDIADKFATTKHRAAVWLTAEKLSGERQAAYAKHGWSGVPTSISHRINVHSCDFDVQIDVL
jgi:hypothetical protein